MANHYYHYMHIKPKKLVSAVAVVSALVLAAATLLMSSFGSTYADHRPGAGVSNVVGACGETTFTANKGGTTVNNMYLVVSANGETQYVNIPATGDAELTVGPFTEDTTVQWRVFGGGERDYDSPHWNGYGEPGFAADVNAYGAANGWSWVISGPDDANPFTTWHTFDVEGCELTATHSFNGGGHLLEGTSKRKNMSDISFGADVTNYNIGGPEGNLDVRFHNVANNDLDKTSFHSTEVIEFNYFEGNSLSCHSAVNITAMGTWNGSPDYKLVLRAGDNGSPNKDDTVRVELFDAEGNKVYDTLTSDFGGGSSCVGTARTDLDKGNLTIESLVE